MAIILCIIAMAAVIGAMAIVRTPRYCQTCCERIDGTPELEDRHGSCWHFECWQAEQHRVRKMDAMIQQEKDSADIA